MLKKAKYKIYLRYTLNFIPNADTKAMLENLKQLKMFDLKSEDFFIQFDFLN